MDLQQVLDPRHCAFMTNIPARAWVYSTSAYIKKKKRIQSLDLLGALWQSLGWNEHFSLKQMSKLSTLLF